MNKLLNILLYPPKSFEKLTDNKGTLAVGIILIGLIDFFLPDIGQTYLTYFTGKPASDIRFNIIAACLMILLLGAIDTVFLSIPLYDIFRFFKKKEGQPHHATPIKVIKVYIMSHFIIVPVNIILYYAIFRNIDKNTDVIILGLSVVLFFFILIWASSIITRGINVLFRFGPLLKRLTFIIVFTWSYLFNMVFDLQIANWLFKIFK